MPTQFPDLKDLGRRPQRYWNADGLPDLTMGLLWLAWGGALAVPAIATAGAWLHWYWMAMPLLLVGGGAGANWMTRKLKERFTFPAAGYVAWREPGPAVRIVAALAAMAVAGGLVAVAMRSETQPVKLAAAPAAGLLIALALLIPVVRWKLPHYLIPAAAALTLSLVILRAELGLEQGLIVLFLVLGGVSAIVGVVRLRLFLRRHPQPAELP